MLQKKIRAIKIPHLKIISGQISCWEYVERGGRGWLLLLVSAGSQLCVNNNDLPATSCLPADIKFLFFIHRNYKMLNGVFCLIFMTSSSPGDSRWLQSLGVSFEMNLLTFNKKSENPHGRPDKMYQVTDEKWVEINNVMGRVLFFHCFFAWPRF